METRETYFDGVRAFLYRHAPLQGYGTYTNTLGQYLTATESLDYG